MFGNDFQESSLKTQLVLLPEFAKPKNIDFRTLTISDLISLLQSLDLPHKMLISEVIKLVKLMLVMPATNAVSERSFSALKRVKADLRSTMSDNRKNHLMALHVHKDYTDNVDIDKIADEVIDRKDIRNVTLRQ